MILPPNDAVEDALHAAICYQHTLALEQAQAAIAKDWARTPVGTATATQQ